MECLDALYGLASFHCRHLEPEMAWRLGVGSDSTDHFVDLDQSPHVQKTKYNE